MRFWHKQKERKLTEAQDAAAVRIAGKLIKVHKQAADYLNRKTAGISAQGWLILLICFSTAFGGYCLMLLLQAFK